MFEYGVLDENMSTLNHKKGVIYIERNHTIEKCIKAMHALNNKWQPIGET